VCDQPVQNRVKNKLNFCKDCAKLVFPMLEMSINMNKQSE